MEKSEMSNTNSPTHVALILYSYTWRQLWDRVNAVCQHLQHIYHQGLILKLNLHFLFIQELFKERTWALIWDKQTTVVFNLR